MSTTLEINGYGIFGSFGELKKNIREREQNGLPLIGEAEILPGAVVIHGEQGLIRLLDPNREYQRLHVRIGPTGKFIASYERNNFNGDVPAGWQEIENP